LITDILPVSEKRLTYRYRILVIVKSRKSYFW